MTDQTLRDALRALADELTQQQTKMATDQMLAMLHIVFALKSQPGFDQEAFAQEIHARARDYSQQEYPLLHAILMKAAGQGEPAQEPPAPAGEG
jgi:hypothetical protein